MMAIIDGGNDDHGNDGDDVDDDDNNTAMMMMVMIKLTNDKRYKFFSHLFAYNHQPHHHQSLFALHRLLSIYFFEKA